MPFKDGWLTSATINRAASDAGSHLGPVTVGVLHTTESPEGRFKPRARDYFGHQSYPHFTVDVQGGVFRVFQHIAIHRAAKALANRSGGVNTNREGCIQIEVVGSATRPLTNVAVMRGGLAQLMREIEAATSIPRSRSVAFKAYPASYGEGNGVRLSGTAWERYAGWLGHQHVPENSHGDPGAIDIQALLGAAPVTQEDDSMKLIRNVTENSATYGQIALLGGPRVPFEVVNNPEIAGALQAALGTARGVNAREFDLTRQYLGDA